MRRWKRKNLTEEEQKDETARETHTVTKNDQK
jgi:hypothetical protein